MVRPSGVCTVAALLCGVMACGQGGGAPEGADFDGDGKADFGYQPDPEFDYSICPGGEPRLVTRPDGSSGPAAWTVMHYAAADNNLEDVLLEDINEMERGLTDTDNVNVVVQLDVESEDGMWRYEVRPGPALEYPGREDLASDLVYETDEEVDSGQPETLVDFARWAVGCYPAERYGFIIGGHGGGWSVSPLINRSRGDDDRRHRTDLSLRARMYQRFHARTIRRGGTPRGSLPEGRTARGVTARMIAPDDSHGSEIYVDELAGALEEIRRMTVRCGETASGWECESSGLTNRLAFYGSDACLMGDLGVIFDLRNTAMYIIGSEETEPGQGWPYNTVIRTLSERPYVYAQRPHQLAQAVVSAYGRSYGPGGSAEWDDYNTLSAIDTAGVWQVANTVETIAETLGDLLEVDGVADHVWDARAESYGFGDGYTDIGLFLALLRQSLVEADLMPEVGEHIGDGDERFRTLRDAIDTLLDEEWAQLVVANHVTESFEGAMGASVFLPMDECGYGISVGDFAKSGFAQATGWDDLVSALSESPGEPDYYEGYGYGHTDFEISIDDEPLSEEPLEAYVECELYEEYLYVYVEGYDDCVAVEGEEECIYPPDLSFDINTGSRMVESLHIWSSADDFDIDAEAYDASLAPIEVEDWDSGTYYHGSFAVTLPREHGSEEMVQVRVSFECDEFELYYGCEDDWW